MRTTYLQSLHSDVCVADLEGISGIIATSSTAALQDEIESLRAGIDMRDRSI